MKLLLVALMAISISAKAQLSCTGKITAPLFNFTGGVQTFTVPAGVTTITIKTRGATGGLAPSSGNSAGGGAIMEADYTVTPGQVVTILVGGSGVNGNDFESGGGGATGVYINGVLKLVAGGGGGEDNTGNGGNGQSGTDGTSSPVDGNSNCTCSRPVNGLNGLGGTGGTGGNHGEFCAGCIEGGAGGGGFSSAGQGNGNNNAGRPGGQGNIAGAAGGLGSADDAVGINGGWGWASGGGADDRESGGGGGYSGGGGGPEGFNPGGGGSFSSPTGRTALFSANGALTTTASNGLVTICYFSTLSLTLQSFSGRSQGSYNHIQWKTADEFNLDKFIVEKSIDGRNFLAIGEVAPTNNGIGKVYELRDNNLLNNSTFYYRLRIIEFGGSEKLSAIINLRKNGQSEKITLYPNPVTDNLIISSNSTITKIEIIDIIGKTIYTIKKVNLTDPIPVWQLSKGIYIFKAYSGSEIIIKKFIKQ
jgi:hypothetical protein